MGISVTSMTSETGESPAATDLRRVIFMVFLPFDFISYNGSSVHDQQHIK
jgi:hypothetical protein